MPSAVTGVWPLDTCDRFMPTFISSAAQTEIGNRWPVDVIITRHVRPDRSISRPDRYGTWKMPVRKPNALLSIVR